MTSRTLKKPVIVIDGYIRELSNAFNLSQKIPSTLTETVLIYYLVSWQKMEDTPIKVMFNSVTIDNAIYLFPDHMTDMTSYLNNFCNRKYVDLDAYCGSYFKYDAVHDSFQVIGKYPSMLTSIAKTVSYNGLTRAVTLIGGTHDVFGTLRIPTTFGSEQEQEKAIPLTWDLSRNFQGAYETTGSNPASIFIDGKFHMIGGHNSYYHEVWDSRQRRMRPVYKFSSRLKSRELVYCRRLDSLIMFGGCLWNERNFQQTQRYRYINGFYQCRKPNDLRQIKWHKVKEWRLPYKMIGFGHLLLDDTNLLIFGGRVNGGKLLDEVWMLDLVKTLWYKSTLRIPQKGKFRAHHLVDNRGGTRKRREEVHLFQYGHPSNANQAHFRVSLEALMSSMEVVGRSPPRPKRRVAPAISTAELEKELVARHDLSKNRKRKILRKLQKKMWKQYMQKQKQIEMDRSIDLKLWMKNKNIYEETLFAELSSFEVKTKDDIQELTQDDLDRVLTKVRDVRLRQHQGPTLNGQRASAIDEDLAKVESWLKMLRAS